MTIKNFIDKFFDRKIYKYVVKISLHTYHFNDYEELVGSYGKYYIQEYEVDFNRNIVTFDIMEEA